VATLVRHGDIDATGTLVEFTSAGRVTLAVMTWMALWWVTEAIDIFATALLPIAVLPTLGAVTIGEATARTPTS